MIRRSPNHHINKRTILFKPLELSAEFCNGMIIEVEWEARFDVEPGSQDKQDG